jgi:murein DD-endopeptidase MepM/ murein hydrolase activator NlpD
MGQTQARGERRKIEEGVKMTRHGSQAILPYYELNIGETLELSLPEGNQATIRLEAIGNQELTVSVNGTAVTIPLGHFASTIVAQPPGDVVNVVEVEGVKIGADMTRAFMSGSKYSLTLVNLRKDARLYINAAGERLSPPGVYRFPIADYQWNFADNWLNKVPYGWHLGIDPNAEVGQPLVAVTDGTILAIRHYPAGAPEDYWGNNLALLGNDGVLYLYMHWDALAPGIDEETRVQAGDAIGTVGRSGFETKPFPTHLHFEMMLLKHPERFYFAYEVEPEVLQTPNRFLPAEVEGFVINPYPFLVEWYLAGVR